MNKEPKFNETEATAQNSEPTEQANKSKKPKSNKKQLITHILALAIGLILLGGVAGATYWWRDKTANDFEKTLNSDISVLKREKSSLEKQLDEKSEDTGDCPAPCTEIAPGATVIENIQLSITSANTAALIGYMAPSVNVILAASEAYGTQTPTQAVADISTFLTDDLNSWDYDFSLPTATLNSYKQGSYSQYFSTISVVGKATNNHVISFSFNCEGKINTVFLANNAALL